MQSYLERGIADC